jgi:2-keto-4-pentenoate hydratase/2-oxohepta-3-ene-1,7-dioic acid hydratase in catechol pathway
MRLVTFTVDSDPQVGVVVDDRIHALDDLIPDAPTNMLELLRAGGAVLSALRAVVAGTSSDRGASLVDATLLAPIPRPGKIVAVGRNYREHADEEGAAIVADPVLFTKYPSAIVGDGADITWRAEDSGQVDYEAELAVVIGEAARDVPTERALDIVAGYTCLDDVSARDLQAHDGQWVRAKSLDTFCPIGPWLVTRDELPDPTALTIQCRVNGELRQQASTRSMIHGVAELIAFCSRFFTLEPGDVIATGTPGGVGAFRRPPVFLGNGDEVAVTISGIGTLRNRCRVVAGS